MKFGKMLYINRLINISSITIATTMNLYELSHDTWDAQEIVPGIFLGSVYAANDRSQLYHHKIQCILDLSDGAIVQYPEIQYCTFKNIIDHPHQPMTHLFPTTLGFLTYCQRNGLRLLVNCHMGISRSTTIIIAYLIHYHNMTVLHSLSYIRSKRPKVKPNDGFLRELEKFVYMDHHRLQDQIDEECYNFKHGLPVEHYTPLSSVL
jgi:hypothetical protein